MNPLGFSSSSVYDAANRLIASVNPLGFRTSFGYDAASGQVSVTDALGNISTTVFDADRRTLATINANGFATTQVFDAVGQLLAVIDARGNRNSFSYDGAGRQVLSTDALGNMITSQFDAASRQTLRIDGRGLRTSYAYDAASRLIGQQYQDGTRLTNTYDANSQRTGLSDWTGAYTSSFDPVGRLSSVVNPAGIAITYGYDAASQRAWMNQPTGLFTYSYDPAGRIANLVNPEGQTTSWQYDAASRVMATVMANGTLASNTYDNANQLLLLANLTTSGTTLSSFNYTYNPVGNRTQVVEANGDVLTLSYDPTYQLTNEMRSGANAYNISYIYDPVGNRTLLLNSGAATTIDLQRRERVGHQPDQRGCHDQHLRWRWQPADVRGSGEPTDDEYLGRRESADASGPARPGSWIRSPTTGTASEFRSRTRPERPTMFGTGRTSCWRQTAATLSRSCIRLSRCSTATSSRSRGIRPIRFIFPTRSVRPGNLPGAPALSPTAICTIRTAISLPRVVRARTFFDSSERSDITTTWMSWVSTCAEGTTGQAWDCGSAGTRRTVPLATRDMHTSKIVREPRLTQVALGSGLGSHLPSRSPHHPFHPFHQVRFRRQISAKSSCAVDQQANGFFFEPLLRCGDEQ